MPYEPTNWQQGDDITVEKLNKIEQGVADYQIGPKGDPGEDGTNGAKGAKGDKGDQGPAGKDAENQFTDSQKEALLALIENDELDSE